MGVTRQNSTCKALDNEQRLQLSTKAHVEPEKFAPGALSTDSRGTVIREGRILTACSGAEPQITPSDTASPQDVPLEARTALRAVPWARFMFPAVWWWLPPLCLPRGTTRRLNPLEHRNGAVQEIINQALEKLEEIQVPMADYALKSAGAAVIHSKTSPSLRTGKAKVFLYSLPLMDYMRSPELILEAENHPGNCWPFPGSQGHVFIQLSMPVIPRAVTMAHVSGTAFHGESISGAPKDFAVYGFKEEDEEQGAFLGQFTFLAALNPSQTFQLKNELPGVVNYIRLQVLSNWGHLDYTCLYRFRVHGDLPKDGGDTAVSPLNKFR
ncbi:SUN domain-containing protein 3-like [Patagioenas fasciata]|uniref:SUN domain-containing protein 3-like n=1 Tax=Patagioenas fasciata TaxID=372321 RepID=UPI003A994272